MNQGLGIDNARKYTVDPLVYLDRLETYDGTNPSVGTHTVPDPVVSSTLVASVGNPPIHAVKSDTTVHEVPHAEGFTDVPSDHRYATAIGFLKSKNIVAGNNGRFFPDATITRAELLKMVFGAAGTALVTGGKNYFSDVDPASWQASYVNTAKANGIIGGYSDGTFRPNNPITRAEAFKIIINTFHSEALDTVSFPVFGDVPVDIWYAPYALFAKTESLIHFSGNSFEPDRSISRGEVANAIYLLMKK